MLLPKIENKSLEVFKMDFSNIAKKSFIDVNARIDRQPVCVSIGEHYFGQNRYPTAFGSYGDYSCIVGSSKSKKTFLKSAIVAGYIGGQSDEYFENIRGHDNEGRYVIDIDTEQSRYHSQKVFKRVVSMVGANYEYYVPFSLREISANDRFEFIDWIFNESEYRGKIGLMSIDGYVDLINDFNSLEQSQALSEKLLQWTSKHQCHITGILHKNFGSDKPVGHIGSTILKKAETVLFINNEDEFTSVKCKYSRNLPIEDFNFSVNNEWLPYKL